MFTSKAISQQRRAGNRSARVALLLGGLLAPATAHANLVEVAGWTELVHEAAPHPRDSGAFAWDDEHHHAVLFCGDSGGGLLGDTWIWDGASWAQASPDAAPAPRVGAGAAYDAAHHAVILFGGQGPTGLLGDTWQWTGATWVQLHPSDAPSPRLGAAMAYDPVLHVVLLFGGQGASGTLGDTWTWNGSTWSQATGITSPPPRTRTQIAFDPTRHRAVMFGGQPGLLLSSPPLGDTWEWDGTNWRSLSPATSPSPRAGVTETFDAATGHVVLFGGVNTASALGDLWDWDGTIWTQRSFSDGPSPRTLASTVYDPVRQRVVIVSGANRSGAGERSDTWEWDDTAGTWVDRTDRSGPSRRVLPGMAFDRDRGVVVMLGGLAGLPISDLWEWNGAGWTQASTDPLTARSGAAMTYDPIHHVTLIFGGADAVGPRNDTLTWDGHTLTTLNPATQPPARSGAELTWDSSRATAVLYGGLGARDALSDTWEWNGTDWVARDVMPAPPARLGFGMAYDRARSVTTLFGGDSGGGILGDTWEWNGTAWMQRMPVDAMPIPRNRFGMSFDELRAVSVLFGGLTSGGILGDTWEWDGDRWVIRSLSVAPSARWDQRMVFDNIRGQTLLFAGISGVELRADLWAYRVRQVHTNGDACTAAQECYSSVCASSVCCDRPCDGVCARCDLPGFVGICTALPAGTDAGVCGACDGRGHSSSTCPDAGVDAAPEAGPDVVTNDAGVEAEMTDASNMDGSINEPPSHGGCACATTSSPSSNARSFVTLAPIAALLAFARRRRTRREAR